MMNRHSNVYDALANPVRRQVLGMLKDGAHTAGEIADAVAVSKPTLSGHLSVLKNADLVSVERRGAHLLYRINLSVLEEALAGLMDMFAIEEGALGASLARRKAKVGKMAAGKAGARTPRR